MTDSKACFSTKSFAALRGTVTFTLPGSTPFTLPLFEKSTLALLKKLRLDGFVPDPSPQIGKDDG